MSYKPNFIKRIFHSFRFNSARIWMRFQPATVIAITGSQGKTNLSRLLYSLIHTLGKTAATDINLDTVYNVPITALKVKPVTKYAIFELGVDHPGEMDRYLKIVRPKIAAVTGISSVHTDEEHLGSLEKVIWEKRKLIKALPKDGFAVLNWDDPNVRGMARHTSANIIRYGSAKEDCDIYFNKKEIAVSKNGTALTLHTKEGSVNIVTPLIGLHHAYNIAAAYAIYRILDHKLNNDLRFSQKVLKVKPLKSRMSLENGPLGTLMLDDSKRANPVSTEAGLRTFDLMPHEGGRKIAVLAEMGELADPEEEHRKIGMILAGLKIDHLVCIGPYQKFVRDTAVKFGFPEKNIFWTENILIAADHLKEIAKENDFIYLKGSHLRHLERVMLVLEGIQVGCSVVSCPFYWHCRNCPYLRSGYQNRR